jgi:CelD/BcsL family acetyltransferase involved in cellulose biosynthesis
LGGALKLEIIDDFDALRDRAEAWDAFMVEQACEIFLSYDWCRTWWEFYGSGRELKVCWFTAQDRTVAVLPLFIERPLRGSTLKVVRLVSSDHMPVTLSIPILPDYLEAVLGDVSDKLIEWGVGMLQLGAIAGKYPDLERLVEACRTSLSPRFRTTCRQTDVQTYYTVEANWERQLAGLSRKQRSHMRQTFRDAEAPDMELRSDFADRETLADFFDGFVRMHQLHWEMQKKAGHFRAWPEAPAFHRCVAERQLERGRLRLMRVSLHGSPVGYRYAYRLGSTYHSFLEARAEDHAPRRIGYARLIFGELVRKAQAEGGIDLIDSMRGYYEHKTHLGGETRPVHMVEAVSGAWKDACRVAVLRRTARLMDVLYYRIWRRRLAPRLGRARGSFWGSWIRLHPFS